MSERLSSEDHIHPFNLLVLSNFCPAFQMVAETSSQRSAEQQAEQSSVQATQDLQDALAQSESRAKALESQAEALQKVSHKVIVLASC